MNLPFGRTAFRENSKKKEDAMEFTTYYERKLADYRDALERYNNYLFDYKNRLDGYEKRSMENQPSIVQTALDLTYLKEQGDNVIEQFEQLRKDIKEELKDDQLTETVNHISSNIEGLAASILDANYKLDGLDKNVVNRLSELMLELQKQSVYQSKQIQSETTAEIDRLSRSVKRGQALLWFLFIISLLSLSGIAFLVLYIMEIIPF